jgi:hypothetical protein
MSVTADLTPVGPYKSGQTVLLVVDVTNVGGRALRRLSVVNQASNLTVEPLWGGCESAPCPPFALAALRQKQVTLPATITDAGQPIFDVVTVSGDGITRQAVVRIVPPPPPPPPPKSNLWTYVLGAAGLALAGGAGAWLARSSPAAQRARWAPRIAATGALASTQEASVGDVKFAAPPISVRAHMDPPEPRFEGPIPVGPTPPNGSPGGAASGNGPPGAPADKPTPDDPSAGRTS